MKKNRTRDSNPYLNCVSTKENISEIIIDSEPTKRPAKRNLSPAKQAIYFSTRNVPQKNFVNTTERDPSEPSSAHWSISENDPTYNYGLGSTYKSPPISSPTKLNQMYDNMFKNFLEDAESITILDQKLSKLRQTEQPNRLMTNPTQHAPEYTMPDTQPATSRANIQVLETINPENIIETAEKAKKRLTLQSVKKKKSLKEVLTRTNSTIENSIKSKQFKPSIGNPVLRNLSLSEFNIRPSNSKPSQIPGYGARRVFNNEFSFTRKNQQTFESPILMSEQDSSFSDDNMPVMETEETILQVPVLKKYKSNFCKSRFRHFATLFSIYLDNLSPLTPFCLTENGQVKTKKVLHFSQPEDRRLPVIEVQHLYTMSSNDETTRQFPSQYEESPPRIHEKLPMP